MLVANEWKLIWCLDTVNCQDGMIMWRKVCWEWGRLSCSSPPHSNEFCSLIWIWNNKLSVVMTIPLLQWCHRRSDREKHLAFFRLSLSNKPLLAKWVANIGRNDLSGNTNTRILRREKTRLVPTFLPWILAENQSLMNHPKHEKESLPKVAQSH